MGDVYKGLTIQIGADVSNLTAALKGVNKAAQNTQSALRRVNKALDANPANLALLTSKMSSIAERASATAVKMRLLGQQLKQMKGTEIEAIVRDTKNLELRAASARDEYARLTRQIAELRTSAVGQLGMPREWGTNLKKYKSNVDAAISKAADGGDPVATALLKQLNNLKREFNLASQELDKMGKAQSLKRVQEDIKETASELKVLVKEATETRDKMLAIGKTSSLKQLNGDLERTEAIAEQVKGEFKTLDEALSLNPNALIACAKRMSNLRQQTDVAKDRLSLLNAKVNELQAAGGTKTNRGIRELASDTLKAKDRMESLRAELLKVEGNLAVVEREGKQFSSVLDASGMERTEASASQLRAKIKTLTAALNEAEHAYDSAKTTQELREVQSEILRTKAQIKNLQTLAKGATGSMSGMFFALRTAGYSISGTIGGAVTMAAYSLVDKAETIDSAFRDMKKTVQGTDEQFAQLRSDAIEYSKTHVTSADTILEIEAMAGQLGIAAKDLESFSTTVSNLDIATDMDSEDIAIDLGKLSNVLSDLNTGNVDKFADALVRLGNNNAALESDIMNITTRFGGMASQVGMTSDEILAWATAASATGVKAESAGSNMLKTLGNINTAVSAGGKKLDSWAEVIGMSADTVKKKWGDGKGGTSEVFKSFISTLSKMKSTDVDSTLQGLGITSVRQRQLIEGLTQSIGTMDDKLQMSKDAWNGVSDEWGNAGDAAYEAEQKSEGFSGAMGKLRNNLAAIADAVGTDLVPYIELATSAIQELGDMYNGLDSSQKDTLFKIAGALVALGPGLTAIGGMGSVFTSAFSAAKWAGTRVMYLGDKVSSLGTKLSGAGEAVTAYAAGTNRAVKGTVSMSKGASSAAKATGNVAKSAGKVSSGMAKVGKALTTVGGSFNLWALGIGAVTLAVLALYDAWSEAQERAELFEDAATGASDTLLSWGEKVQSGVSESASESVKSIEDIRNANEELAKSVVSSNEDTASAMKEAKTQISMLEEYGDTVEKVSKKVQKGKITKKSDLSSKQLGELKSALDGINELTGKDYTIKDIIQQGDVDKAKEVNDELQKTIKLKELSLQTDVYSDKYKDAYEAQITAQENYDEAVKTYNDTVAKNSAAANSTNPLATNSRNWSKKQIESAENAMNEAKKNLDNTTADVDKWKQAMNTVSTATAKGTNSLYALVSQNSSAFAALSSNGYLQSFMSDLETLGVKYKNLTTDQKENTGWLSTLVSSYDGTTSSLVESLNNLGIKYDETKAKAVDLRSAISTAIISSSATIGGDTSIALKVDANYGDVDTFIQKVKDAGYSVEELSKLTPVNWASILNTSNIGSATDGISTEVKSKIDSALKSADVTAKVDADTNSANSKLDATKTKAKELGKQKPNVKVSADTKSANSELKETLSLCNSFPSQIDTVINITTKKSVSTGASALIEAGKGEGEASTFSTKAVYDGGTVGLSTMALDASYAVDSLDADFGISAQDIYSSVGSAVSGMSALSLGVGNAVKSMSRQLGGGLTVNVAGNDSDTADLLRKIAKNTGSSKGIFLDGEKLVGGTADKYDRLMARRERLAARGVDA